MLTLLYFNINEYRHAGGQRGGVSYSCCIDKSAATHPAHHLAGLERPGLNVDAIFIILRVLSNCFNRRFTS